MSEHIVVAMSGGVDSSVAAALLVEQGYRVTGMMLRLWSEPGAEDFNRCCTPEAINLARRVAARLDIPFYVVDVRETFQREIVDFFIAGYQAGETPNPCMMCNRHIRFGALLNQALALDANYLATGHYARVQHRDGAPPRLLRAVDHEKDQSYVLSALNPAQLSRALFPVGGYPKPEVRELARKFSLPVADRRDSQDLCFLAGGDYRDFLRRNLPEIESPGVVMTRSGEVMGTHEGLAFYTIGQRTGLGFAAPQPYYVLEKDLARNTLIVGTADELGETELTGGGANWISGSPPEAAFEALVKIRYKARETPGRVTPLGSGKVHVRFDAPVRDITPGQWAVFFQEEEVIGAARILRAGQSV